ncbi:unnamed protein product [Calypogeia fissa]
MDPTGISWKPPDLTGWAGLMGSSTNAKSGRVRSGLASRQEAVARRAAHLVVDVPCGFRLLGLRRGLLSSLQDLQTALLDGLCNNLYLCIALSVGEQVNLNR